MNLEAENLNCGSVAVAVSGGADSLLALYLLARRGQACLALHARFGQGQDSDLEKDLQALCQRLQVPLYILDLQRQFYELIIAPFVQAYLCGETPNPCAWCNAKIKFGIMLEKARELGADCLATGHYVRRQGAVLLRGLDPAKDQSYFLALLNRQQVAKVCLPLGQWRKEMVRSRLKQEGLQVPAGTESQEICFIPDQDYRSFLAGQGLELPGPGLIVDTSGRVLGRHQGLYAYTIGQRKGLGIAYSEPLYVLGKDMRNNQLLVGPGSELRASGFLLREANFVLPRSSWPKRIWVQTNYRESPVQAGLQDTNQALYVDFMQERKPATPGQVAAFYSEQGQLLGGGIIHA